jgi:hypothetical protein
MRSGATGLLLSLLLPFAAVEAAPVSVRLTEGSLRGFLVLRSREGTPLAHGELHQIGRGDMIENRLLLQFKDGSVYDETATYTQDRVFTLHAYRLHKHGPSFPTEEVSFDRKTRQYRARTQDKKGDAEKTASGELDMPADLYNGMALVLLKNLAAGAVADVQMAAFTPKPRLLRMRLLQEGEDRASLGGHPRKVIRYLVKLDVRGLSGLIAPLLGKDPPDLRYWLAAGDVPAFVRFEGAMYLNGPVWRLELTTVDWP